jgi:hypothetical protein
MGYRILNEKYVWVLDCFNGHVYCFELTPEQQAADWDSECFEEYIQDCGFKLSEVDWMNSNERYPLTEVNREQG